MDLLEEQLYNLSETYGMLIEYLDDVMKKYPSIEKTLQVIK